MKYVIYILTLIPIYQLAKVSNAIDPYDKWLEITGIWAVIWLSLVLVSGPLGRFNGRFNKLTYGRKPIGLSVSTWMILHIAGYFIFHQNFNQSLFDLISKPFLVIGLLAAVIFSLMAITSSWNVLKMIGPQSWKVLHGAITTASALVVGHGLTAQKVVTTDAGKFILILVLALIVRYNLEFWRVKK